MFQQLSQKITETFYLIEHNFWSRFTRIFCEKRNPIIRTGSFEKEICDNGYGDDLRSEKSQVKKLWNSDKWEFLYRYWVGVCDFMSTSSKNTEKSLKVRTIIVLAEKLNEECHLFEKFRFFTNEKLREFTFEDLWAIRLFTASDPRGKSHHKTALMTNQNTLKIVVFVKSPSLWSISKRSEI